MLVGGFVPGRVVVDERVQVGQHVDGAYTCRRDGRRTGVLDHDDQGVDLGVERRRQDVAGDAEQRGQQRRRLHGVRLVAMDADMQQGVDQAAVDETEDDHGQVGGQQVLSTGRAIANVVEQVEDEVEHVVARRPRTVDRIGQRQHGQAGAQGDGVGHQVQQARPGAQHENEGGARPTNLRGRRRRVQLGETGEQRRQVERGPNVRPGVGCVHEGDDGQDQGRCQRRRAAVGENGGDDNGQGVALCGQAGPGQQAGAQQVQAGARQGDGVGPPAELCQADQRHDQGARHARWTQMHNAGHETDGLVAFGRVRRIPIQRPAATISRTGRGSEATVHASRA